LKYQYKVVPVEQVTTYLALDYDVDQEIIDDLPVVRIVHELLQSGYRIKCPLGDMVLFEREEMSDEGKQTNDTCGKCAKDHRTSGLLCEQDR
jgi:hypothetical protein